MEKSFVIDNKPQYVVQLLSVGQLTSHDSLTEAKWQKGKRTEQTDHLLQTRSKVNFIAINGENMNTDPIG